MQRNLGELVAAGALLFAAAVASSCIDIEAGLSKCDMIRTPPDFCASAIGVASGSDNANAAANPPRFRLIADISPQADATSRHRARLAELCCAGTTSGYNAADLGAIPAVPETLISRVFASKPRLMMLDWLKDPSRRQLS